MQGESVQNKSVLDWMSWTEPAVETVVARAAGPALYSQQLHWERVHFSFYTWHFVLLQCP